MEQTKDFASPGQVRAFLESKEGCCLHEEIRTLFEQSNQDLTERGIPEFATWFFLNQNGLLVDYVAPPEGDSSVLGQPFGPRDYFVVAKRYGLEGQNGMKAVHISRVFKSSAMTSRDQG